MDDLYGELDATGVAAAVRAGSLSAREVVEHALRLIEDRDPLVNAVVETRGDAALAEVDAGLPDGPLTGVPFVVKDLRVGVAGMVNANGSRLFSGRRADADSEIVARYRRAGVVVVATTRTPEFGLNASTEPVVGGPVRNPYRLSRSAGGSSGGTAAAVAVAPPPCRIAISTVRPDGTAAHPECAAAADAAARLVASLGHDVREATPRYPIDAITNAMRVCMAAPLAVEIDTRLGQLGRPLADDDLEPFTRVMYELGKALSGTDVVVALQDVERAGHEVARFFHDVDVLLTPTIAEPAPPLGELDTRDVESMYRRAGTYSALTSFCNVTGQPAVSLPLGHDADGVPIGVQLVGRFGQEDLLLRLGAQIEAAAPWRTAPVWPPRH